MVTQTLKISRKYVTVLCAVPIVLAGYGLWHYHALNKNTQALLPIFDTKKYAVDFHTSMHTQEYAEINQNADWMRLLNHFYSVYERERLDRMQPTGYAKVPKIIHVIWLGGKLPAEYVSYVNSWIEKHPQWIFLFWTDNPLNYDYGSRVVRSFKEVEELLKTAKPGTRLAIDATCLEFENARFFYLSRNYGERSDILKWEVVYRFGGMYVDTDFECFEPFDIFAHTYDFYTGLQPLDTHMVQLGAALFAAKPGHPILKACVEEIKNNQHITPIILKTGPLHFTQCFLKHASSDGLHDIAFPASFFYPCSYEQNGTPPDVWQRPESFAVHHWAGSWLKPEASIPVVL